MLLCQ